MQDIWYVVAFFFFSQNLFLYSILHKLLRLKILERKVYRSACLQLADHTLLFAGTGRRVRILAWGGIQGRTRKETASQVLRAPLAAALLTAGFCFLVVSPGF